MKKLFAVLLFAVMFSLFGFSAMAQITTTQPTPQVYTPPKLLPSASCLGDWTASVYEARQVNVNGGRQPLANAYLIIRVTQAWLNDGGSISCEGKVVGYNGSNMNMFYDPRSGTTEVYVYIPEPILSGANPTYLLQVRFKFFTSPDQNYLFGIMDASFQDNSQMNGNAVNKVLYHGDADMSGGSRLGSGKG